MFLSEVEYKSFCVKFSGLISKLKTPRKIILISANIQRKKHFGAPMKHSEYFASKTQKSGHVIVFRLLAACNEKFQRANVQPFAYAANAIADKAG